MIFSTQKNDKISKPSQNSAKDNNVLEKQINLIYQKLQLLQKYGKKQPLEQLKMIICELESDLKFHIHYNRNLREQISVINTKLCQYKMFEGKQSKLITHHFHLQQQKQHRQQFFKKQNQQQITSIQMQEMKRQLKNKQDKINQFQQKIIEDKYILKKYQQDLKISIQKYNNLIQQYKQSDLKKQKEAQILLEEKISDIKKQNEDLQNQLKSEKQQNKQFIDQMKQNLVNEMFKKMDETQKQRDQRKDQQLMKLKNQNDKLYNQNTRFIWLLECATKIKKSSKQSTQDWVKVLQNKFGTLIDFNQLQLKYNNQNDFVTQQRINNQVSKRLLDDYIHQF